MKIEQVEKLLGRSLTSNEVTNFDLNIKIAIERLEKLVCFTLCDSGGQRIYPARYGYRTQYIDPCTSVESVKIDGVATTDYVLRCQDSYNSDWYDCIEFTNALRGELVAVDGDWGFDTVPYDLQLLIARLFAQCSLEQETDNAVKSKSIEDFSVTYKDAPTFDEFISTNQTIINKYSQCNIGMIRNGNVQPIQY